MLVDIGSGFSTPLYRSLLCYYLNLLVQQSKTMGLLVFKLSLLLIQPSKYGEPYQKDGYAFY